MFSFLLGLGALIAAGAFIVYVVALTVKWITNKVREKLALEKAKKTVVADIKELVRNSPSISLDEFEKLADKEGATHLMFTLDEDDELVDKLELIKDKNNKLPEVKRLLGKEGMVIVDK